MRLLPACSLLALVLAPSAAAARSRPYGLDSDLPWESDDTPATMQEPSGEEVDPPLQLSSAGARAVSWRPPDLLHGHRRLAAGAGLRVGTFLVNNVDTGTNLQAHLDLGVRKRRWWLAAEYALMSVTLPGDRLATRGIASAPEDVDGLVHRFGAFVRYSVSRLGCRDAGFDVYVEAGAGIQHLRWDAGGAWTRPDLSLGFGFGGWFAGDHEHAGVTVGLRVTLAPRNDVEHAPATCAGPCDHATPPTGVDRSFLFDVTIPFGR